MTASTAHPVETPPRNLAIRLRGLVFDVLFYLNLAAFLLIGLPLLLGPRKWAIRALQLWGRASLWLCRVIVGMDVEFRGLDNIPEGPLLVACKHQSQWDTFAIFPLFDDPVSVQKHELFWIPVHGWFSLKFRMIPVYRGGGRKVVEKLVQDARIRIADGRQIVIFPEGTRTAAGAPPRYKRGIGAMYGGLGVACLPIALNSGMFWPRRSSLRLPGTVLVEILEPIPPGLEQDVFQKRLEKTIETASNRLIAETEAARKQERRNDEPA